MTTSNNVGSASQGQNSLRLPLVLIGIALVAYFVLRSRSPIVEDDFIGVPRPPLTVAGWLNTNVPPSDEALRGKVVLIDTWASWCGPCRAEMPRVVEFRKRFRDQGVVVIGLTPEKGDELPDVQKYVQSVVGLDWPIGYGADVPMDMLGITAIPTFILFDQSGTSVWASHSVDGLDDAVVKALAQR